MKTAIIYAGGTTPAIAREAANDRAKVLEEEGGAWYLGIEQLESSDSVPWWTCKQTWIQEEISFVAQPVIGGPA